MPKALLSVYDKSGLVDFARGLIDLGWELLASGGTAKLFCMSNLAVPPEASSSQPKETNPRASSTRPDLS